MESKILAFDDLISKVMYFIDNASCTEEFTNYVKWVDNTYALENKKMAKDIEVLKKKLSSVETQLVEKDRQLTFFKLQVNKANLEKTKVAKERDEIRQKLKQVTRILLDETSCELQDETRATIGKITSTVDLNTPIINSGNHSLFSELSFSTDTDNISEELVSEESFIRRIKPHVEGKTKKTANISSILKRTMPNHSLESSEEEFHSAGDTSGSPRRKVHRVGFATESIHRRPHHFVKYKSLIPHKCNVCSKLMSFQSDSSKCDLCKVVVHCSCEAQVPIPCVPAPCTPTHLRKTISGKISAYTPFVPPMIPGLIIHCINAVEKTGLTQECIYKFDGHSSQIKELLKELTSEKKTNLASLLQSASIHSVCSALKEFFLSLDEHLIPASNWKWFNESLAEEDKEDVQRHMFAGIADLPQPNRDTLAYIMLHLQRVADSSTTKMTKRELAQIFGPIIIGNDSSPESTTANAKTVQVFEHLLNLSPDYWNQFIVVAGPVTPTMQDLRNTPTSDMALVQTINRRGLNTPYRTFTRSEQKKRYFKKLNVNDINM